MLKIVLFFTQKYKLARYLKNAQFYKHHEICLLNRD